MTKSYLLDKLQADIKQYRAKKEGNLMQSARTIIGILLGALLTMSSPVFASSTIVDCNPTYTYKPWDADEGIVVKLPRDVSGEELARVIPAAVQKVPELKMSDFSKYIYIPGTTKRIADSYRFKIYQPWLFGSFIMADWLSINFKYDERYACLMFGGYIKSTNDVEFKAIRENFEKLVQNIYEALEQPQ